MKMMTKRNMLLLALLLVFSFFLIGCDENFDDQLLEEYITEQGMDEERVIGIFIDLLQLEQIYEALEQELDEEKAIALEEMLEAEIQMIEKELDETFEEIVQNMFSGYYDEMPMEEATALMGDLLIEIMLTLEDVSMNVQNVIETFADENGINVDDLDVPEITEEDLEAYMDMAFLNELFMAAQPFRVTTVTMGINDPTAMIEFADMTEYIELDQPPVIQNSRTLVPLRFIGEALGADIQWNEEERSVTYTTIDAQLVLVIDDRRANVNGVLKEMDVAPTIINGRTMVPVRFVSEELGFNVSWDGENQIVTVQNTF